MSVTCSNSLVSYLVPRKWEASFSNQTSAPFSLTLSTILSITSWSFKILPVFLLTNTHIGTPQALCLDIHQSGRVSIIPESLDLPDLGKKLVLLIASIAFCLSCPVSILINHCGVFLKISGALERQE